MIPGSAALWLVARREVRESLRRKTVWIVAGLLLVGSSAAMIVPELLHDDSSPRYSVVVVGGGPSLERALHQAVESIDGRLDLAAAPDVAAATRRIEDDKADVGVVGGDAPAILAERGKHDRLSGAVFQAIGADMTLRRLQAAGLTSGEAQSVLHAPAVRFVEVDAGGARRQGAAFALSFVTYLLLFQLMMQVATGTAVEKSNRISEVLLGIVRPGALLFGKVIGVGCIGLVAMLCGAAPVLVKLAVGGDLPEGLAGALLGGGAWFILGVALYMILAGALGSLVERQEEVGTIVTPLMILLVGAYVVGSGSPEGPLARVLAFVPLTSPMVMPSRIAVGAASAVEMAISLAVSVVAVVVAARLSSVVYRRAIVRTGRRLKLRDVLRAP